MYATSSRVKEAARRAGLTVKMTMMEELHALEEGEVKMRQQREKMELRLQLEQAKAEEEVFESLCPSEISGKYTTRELQIDRSDFKEKHCAEQTKYNLKDPTDLRNDHVERTKSNSNEPTNLPNDHVERMKSNLNEPTNPYIERSSIELVRKMQLPTLQLQPFNGDPTQFNNFIRGFDAKIAGRVEDDEEKLYYLDQYTVGKPKDIVSSCLYMAHGTGYREARRLLQERYGNPVQTVTHMIEKIKSWPFIGSEPDALDKFAIFLRGILNALDTMP